MAESPQAYEFRAEIRQLLNILAHSLYTDREIFLRELISNASDALHRVQFEMLTNREVRDADAEPAIRISFDPSRRTLTIADNGIGMTDVELVENLGTIAHSGAVAFLQQVRDTQVEHKPTADVIGQFGVGFYSAFMVADAVHVTSRSYRPDAPAYTWISRGDNTYTIEPGERAERGTSVTLHLKEDADEFMQAHRLEQIVKKHSDFVPFPIYLEGRAEPLNQRSALWRRAPREVTREQYEDFYKQLTLDFEPPRVTAHVSTDAPVQLHAILFVPARREKGVFALRRDHGLKLYSRKILIQEYNQDLLPKHFRFVEGVVDSEDLPLNISRESVQGNRVVERMRAVLTRRVQGELEQLARDKPEEYAALWREFGAFVKEGVAVDPAARDDLLKLLRFPSSRGEELVSLQAYVERMAEGQPAIYFVLGDDVKSAARSPHLDPLRKRGYETLYWVDPIDAFLPAVVHEFAGKPLRNADDADLGLPPAPEEPEAEAAEQAPEDAFARLIERCRNVLGERVTDVRVGPQLTDSPARLVSPSGSADRDMQRVRRLLEQDYSVPKKILELNRGHALVRNLATLLDRNTALVELCIEQLYADALLVDGLHPDPAEMVGRIQQLMEAATGG
jgi:molecular chaperone HtpG